MPLLDHFHPPLKLLRPWEAFHAKFTSTLADILNDRLLPREYIALEQVHWGSAIEIDVATFGESASNGAAPGGPVGTLPRVWTPGQAATVLPGEFPPRYTVEIRAESGGRSLAAAIELVSPGNKDRAEKRRLFASKCATYLARGVGLVIVDTVTERSGNLHNEMIDMIGMEPTHRFPDDPSLYSVAYRPLARGEQGWIDTWFFPLALGSPLPTVPLSLYSDLCIAVDLEAAYVEACRRQRISMPAT